MGVLSISGEEFRRDRTTDLTSSLVTSLKENTQSTRRISKYIFIYIYNIYYSFKATLTILFISIESNFETGKTLETGEIDFRLMS